MVNHMTGIAWATGTCNPFKGCLWCSPECDSCYAVNWAIRHQAMGTTGYNGTVADRAFTGVVNVVPKEIETIKKVRSERLFVNSMSDTFHNSVSDEDIRLVFEAMAENTQGTNFLICTKRSGRLAKMASSLPITDNMWIGVTVGCQKSLYRLDHLRRVPAAIRWVSVEPMLEKLDLTPWMADGTLNWVVVGGESGKGHREMKPEWAQAILEQCRRYGVPFFLKQWSAFSPKKDVEYPPTLEGRVWHEFPVVKGAAPTSPPTSPGGSTSTQGKDPKRVAAARKAWATMRARKAASSVQSVATVSDPPPTEEASEAPPLPVAPGAALTGGTIPSQSPFLEFQDKTFTMPSPKLGNRDVILPMVLQGQVQEGIDFPITKHLFWFEHERLMALRQKMVASMVTIPTEEGRRAALNQIHAIDAYDRARPKIRKKTWTRFRRSDRVNRLALIRALDASLTGFFAVTGGTMIWNRYLEPYLWVEKGSDATLLRLRGFIMVDGVREELELHEGKKRRRGRGGEQDSSYAASSSPMS